MREGEIMAAMDTVTQKPIIRSLRLKVKPDSVAWLNKAAREVNFVWNWANETSAKAARRYAGPAKRLSGFELNNLSAGASEYFERIDSNTIQRINCEFAQKRRASKKVQLRWRKSSGAKRSLGWVPFKAINVKLKGSAIRFSGKTIRVFESARLQGIKWKDGCFAQDAVGDWWFCAPVEIQAADVAASHGRVGIDLGLKTTATTSDGETLYAGDQLRLTHSRIAQAQRRGHKRTAKRLHRKVARQRKDALHKFTRGIVNRYQEIIIGNVSASKMVKTRMAKSVLDASWATLVAQLHYKGQQAGRRVEVVNEAYTTRACSSCGGLTGPSGLRQLVVREWQCRDCGTLHDRDVNAARNIAMLAPRLSASVCGNRAAPCGVSP